MVIVAFLLFCLNAGSSFGAELPATLRFCDKGKPMNCEASVPLAAFKNQSKDQIRGAVSSIVWLRSEKTEVLKSSARISKNEVRIKFTIAPLAPHLVQRAMNKPGSLSISFDDSGTGKKQLASARANSSQPHAASPKAAMIKRTVRTPAKEGHLLHQSVNQLSPGRQSAAPMVERDTGNGLTEIRVAH